MSSPRLRSRVAAGLLAFAAAWPTATLAAQTQQAARANDPGFPSDSVVFALIKQRVEEKRSTGIVVGMLEPNGKTRIVAYGDPGPGQLPLDGNSVFEIGSISKVFTATVLAELVQEGKVSLDDPVQKFLPATVKIPSRGGKPITLGHLSVQNSGLPRMPDNFHPADMSNPYADYTVAQMYDFLSGYQLPRDPGAKFEYSNLGVGLLGHTLALREGKSYEEMERERVWQPLGMTNTAIVLTPWMKQHLALGHDERGGVVANWDLPTLAGAGAIRSTTVDMLKFIDANLHPERGPVQKAMDFAHQARGFAGAPTVTIGLNWIIQHVGADSIIWHNGGTGGYRTFAGFAPTRGAGVVVMTNSTGVGADDIGMHLLNPAVPLAPKPVPKQHGPIVTVSQTVLQSYVGTYELQANFLLEVSVNDGSLYVHPTAQPTFRLTPTAETEFYLTEVDAEITFVRDPQGKVTQLVLHQNGQNMAAKKVK